MPVYSDAATAAFSDGRSSIYFDPEQPGRWPPLAPTQKILTIVTSCFGDRRTLHKVDIQIFLSGSIAQGGIVQLSTVVLEMSVVAASATAAARRQMQDPRLRIRLLPRERLAACAYPFAINADLNGRLSC